MTKNVKMLEKNKLLNANIEESESSMSHVFSLALFCIGQGTGSLGIGTYSSEVYSKCPSQVTGVHSVILNLLA